MVSADIKNHAPEPGQTVFSRDGRRAEYVTGIEGAHIVRPWVMITSWDGEEEYSEPGGLDTWPEIFPHAPTAVLEDEIIRLQEHIAIKRQELAIATDEAVGFIRGEKERQARLSRHEALARLDDFISGKITHVVKVYYGSISIHEFKEIFEPDDRYDRNGLKLLTLFGKPGNGLQWQVNRYSDGSGQDTQVYPCLSYDDAFLRAASHLGEEFSKADDERVYWLREAVKSADKLGILVPDAARARVKKDALESLNHRRKTEIEALAKIEAEIAAFSEAETAQ